MKLNCASPFFAKYGAQPVNDSWALGFMRIGLPADAPLSALEPQLADTVAMIAAFTSANVG